MTPAEDTAALLIHAAHQGIATTQGCGKRAAQHVSMAVDVVDTAHHLTVADRVDRSSTMREPPHRHRLQLPRGLAHAPRRINVELAPPHHHGEFPEGVNWLKGRREAYRVVRELVSAVSPRSKSQAPRTLDRRSRRGPRPQPRGASARRARRAKRRGRQVRRPASRQGPTCPPG